MDAGCRDDAAGTWWVSTKQMAKRKFRAAKDGCPVLLSKWSDLGMEVKSTDEVVKDEGSVVKEEGKWKRRGFREDGRVLCQACGACR